MKYGQAQIHVLNGLLKTKSQLAESDQGFIYKLINRFWKEYLTSQDVFVPGPSLRISDSTRC